MKFMKIVTICGSFKFKDVMLKLSAELEIKNNYVILQPVYGADNENYTEDEMETLGKLHMKRIEISDAIYVVNVNGYIGTATEREIEYAKSLNKEIFSLEPLNH